jgi:four helix bundle protein
MAQDYRELIVWQRAMTLTALVYKLTESFPRRELYGLTSQMCRASISIASNIAEGRGRANSGEFRQFLAIARGSTCEIQTQLQLSKMLGYGSPSDIDEALARSDEISKMLLAFIQKLTKTDKHGSRLSE